VAPTQIILSCAQLLFEAASTHFHLQIYRRPQTNEPTNKQTMSITPQLLDTLLSSAPTTAEKHYHSIPTESRIIDLTSLLVQHHPTNAAEEARSLLAATLLRRDLSTVDNNENGGAVGTIGEPLIGLFERSGSDGIKRMVGRCVAELCGGEWMGSVLKRLEGGVSLNVFDAVI
jgi:hypothetical protein